MDIAKNMAGKVDQYLALYYTESGRLDAKTSALNEYKDFKLQTGFAANLTNVSKLENYASIYQAAEDSWAKTFTIMKGLETSITDFMRANGLQKILALYKEEKINLLLITETLQVEKQYN